MENKEKQCAKHKVKLKQIKCGNYICWICPKCKEEEQKKKQQNLDFSHIGK